MTNATKAEKRSLCGSATRGWLQESKRLHDGGGMENGVLNGLNTLLDDVGQKLASLDVTHSTQALVSFLFYC